MPFYVSPEDLRRFVEGVFVAAGAREEDAALIADHLVEANLRGVDSHGVVRVYYYTEGIERGFVKPRAEIKVVRETDTSAVIDGGGMLGIPVAMRTLEMALYKAERFGIAAAAARNLGHVGMLAYYTKRGAERGYVTFAAANSPARIAPWGGCEKIFGTNPFSISFPARGAPVVVDMATSILAGMKVMMAAERGEVFPEPIGVSPSCRQTADPREALEGALLPFGRHKGYAIALAVELLSHALAGGPSSTEVTAHPSTQGGFFILALSPAALRDLDDYLDDVERLKEKIRASKPAEGFERVMLPGEPEEETYTKRLKEGIPLDDETWKKLEHVSKKYGVKLPPARRL
ncbi:MAG: Ldh family oxidoreductase [Thermoproteota archaeon]